MQSKTAKKMIGISTNTLSPFLLMPRINNTNMSSQVTAITINAIQFKIGALLCNGLKRVMINEVFEKTAVALSVNGTSKVQGSFASVKNQQKKNAYLFINSCLQKIHQKLYSNSLYITCLRRFYQNLYRKL